MKQKESFVRILMISVIMFGVQTTASAQFGGLKKLAKNFHIVRRRRQQLS